MPSRVIAIGDIHGCSIALSALIAAINPQRDDTVVTLGDYVDRGADSKGVLDQLMDLSKRCHLIPILGNHDEMMLHSRLNHTDLENWMSVGGDASLESYGPNSTLEQIPLKHFQFLEQCVSYFQTDTHFFVHANYDPHLPLDQIDDDTIRWLSLRDYIPGPHDSGKIAVVGHTPQPEVLDLGHLICIDTNCWDGGWLTALDVVSGRTWQVDIKGNCRRSTFAK